MARALNLLLTGCLLQGALCRKFDILIPKTMKVLSGSCVTIPCSFDIMEQYDRNLDSTCKAVWKNGKQHIFDSNTPQQSTIKGNFIGNLQNKNCSTTLNDMRPDYSDYYKFRLQCDGLGNNYETKKLKIHVTAVPPTPTLTPSRLKGKEGTSVSLKCSAAAPCLSHPPALTWTPSLGDSRETLQENQDKTKDVLSVLTFTASHLHHGKEISCTAAYKKQDGSTESSVSSLTADISFAPKILPSSDCAKPTGQINCSCETVGNPPPTLHWYLDGLPVNHSDEFTISNESVNGTGLRSIIIVNQLQKKDLPPLVCHSTNSLGSASQKCCVHSSEHQTSAESQGRLMLPVFITTVVALLALVCVLLFVIRTQRTRHNLPNSQFKGDTSTVTTSQHLASGEGNEVPNTTEEEIYANTGVLTQLDTTISETNSTNLLRLEPKNADGDDKRSEEKKEEGSDMIYSNVNWKSKKKKGKDSLDMA